MRSMMRNVLYAVLFAIWVVLVGGEDCMLGFTEWLDFSDTYLC